MGIVLLLLLAHHPVADNLHDDQQRQANDKGPENYSVLFHSDYYAIALIDLLHYTPFSLR